MDWYVRGRTSNNIFLRFLSYYISLESVASAIIEGDADINLGFLSICYPIHIHNHTRS